MKIKYLGLEFKPIGNIVGGGFCFRTRFMTNEYEIRNENYSHSDFYKIAKKKHCSCDVYECNGKLYIPCNFGFSGLTDNVKEHLKYCDEYATWYKWSRK